MNYYLNVSLISSSTKNDRCQDVTVINKKNVTRTLDYTVIDTSLGEKSLLFEVWSKNLLLKIVSWILIITFTKLWTLAWSWRGDGPQTWLFPSALSIHNLCF